MSLSELLQDAQQELLALRQRQFALEAFDTELERVCRGLPFWRFNSTIWQMMLDHRDKNVIDFASWVKAAYSPGGLFGMLQAHHLNALAGMKRSWGTEKEDRLGEMFDETFFKRHRRLFPQADVKPDHVQALRNAFTMAVDPLVQDRHNHRAHIFEAQPDPNVRMLNLVEIREVYDAIRDLLNDLTLITTGSEWALVDLNLPSSDQTAEELVDLMLLPPLVRRDRTRLGMSRDDLYASLHDDRARTPTLAGKEMPFNAPDRFVRVLPRDE